MNRLFACAAAAAVLGGCAHVDFYDEAGRSTRLPVYYGKPQTVMTVSNECAVAFSTIATYESKGSVRLVPGIGNNNLTVQMSNGVLTNVGQATDTKVADAASALGSIAKLIAPTTFLAEYVRTGTCAIPPGVYVVNNDGQYQPLTPVAAKNSDTP